jgi:hypothetical protein
MNSAEPPVVFVREAANERWRIEAADFARLRSALGPDVTNAFCRCFVHADRLTSLIGFALLSEDRFGKDSPPFQRDLQTVVWFMVGTLRELALAIRDLRSALARRDKLDVTAAPWVLLREVERRWEDDAFNRTMRNVVAFHVDPDMTEKGLEALAKQERVVLVRGEGRPQRHTFLSVGLEALFMGSTMDLADFERFMVSVGNDQAVGSAVEEAFVLALNAVGIPFHEERPGA